MSLSTQLRATSIGVLALVIGMATCVASADASGWRAPSILSAGSGNAVRANVVTDAAGNAFAVWEYGDGNWTRVQISERPAGGGWSTPMTISADGANAARPQIAADDRGNAVVTWQRYDGQALRVQAIHRDAGGAWSAPATLSAAGQAATDPRVVIDASGNATAAWRRYDGGSWRVQAATRLAGGAWSTTATLSAAGSDADEVELAVDGAGLATVVWQRHDGQDWRVQAARRPVATPTWSLPVTLSSAGQDALSPHVAASHSGDTSAVWVRADGVSDRVQASSLAAQGGWSGPVELSAAGQDAAAPRVALHRDGSSVAVWLRSDGQYMRLETASRSTGGQWGSAAILSGAGADAALPQLAVDDAGNAVALWQGLSGSYRAHAATKAPGSEWTAPSTLSEPSPEAILPRLAASASGHAVASWHRFDGARDRIEAAAFDRVGPLLTDVRVPATAMVGVAVPMSVAPVDVWSELQPAAWEFGDGTSASGMQLAHAFTTPGTYPVTVTVADSLGNAASTTRMIEVAPGAVAPPPHQKRIMSVVQSRWAVSKRVTKLLLLRVRKLPRGAAVSVRCKGGRPKRCAFERRTIGPKQVVATVNLRSLFRKQTKLRVGAKLVVRLAQPGVIGRHLTYTIRAGKPPTVRARCLRPGSSAPAKCPA